MSKLTGIAEILTWIGPLLRRLRARTSESWVGAALSTLFVVAVLVASGSGATLYLVEMADSERAASRDASHLRWQKLDLLRVRDALQLCAEARASDPLKAFHCADARQRFVLVAEPLLLDQQRTKDVLAKSAYSAMLIDVAALLRINEVHQAAPVARPASALLNRVLYLKDWMVWLIVAAFVLVLCVFYLFLRTPPSRDGDFPARFRSPAGQARAGLILARAGVKLSRRTSRF
jgi:hypothetical protein